MPKHNGLKKSSLLRHENVSLESEDSDDCSYFNHQKVRADIDDI